jgi:hypothetical protein
MSFTTSAVSNIIESNIKTDDLSFGLHTLYYRVKDSKNRYSSTNSSFFFKKLKTESLDKFEYWFNEDAANAKSVPLTTNDVNISLDTKSLNSGIYTLHYRVKTKNNSWSALASSMFVKVQEVGIVDELEYWFNDDANTTSRIPVNSGDIDLLLPTSGLANGIYTLNYRVKTDANSWSALASSMFIKLSNAGKVNELEYWFDNNTQSKSRISVNSGDINVSLPTATLPTGIYTLNYRVKTDANSWSAVTSSMFLKKSTLANQITELEYWFDDSYESKKSETVASNSIDLALNTDKLSFGLHTVNYRVKTKSNDWSAVVSALFMRNPISDSQISAIEYWVDDRYDSKISSDVSSNTLDISIQMENIPFGMHILNYRVKNKLNIWSSVVSKPFLQIGKSGIKETTSMIEGYRYWFDDDMSKVTSVALNSKAVNADLILDIPINLSGGDHKFSIQLYDNRGYWSAVVNKSIKVSATSGIEELHKDDKIKVYFDLNKDNLVIENAYNYVQIYSATGKLIYQKNNIEELETIPTASWNSGVYVIKVGSEDKQIKTSKIIK